MKPDDIFYKKLVMLAEKLVELNKIRAVSLNHSIMELLVAKHLFDQGYENVDIEVKIDDLLIADVVGYKEAKVVVEIETGFVPAEYASEPNSYLRARLASKIARYSFYADVFILAFPTYYIPPIPKILLQRPHDRDPMILRDLKSLIDKYYKNPPIDYEYLTKAYLHKLYMLDIDEGVVKELSPEELNEFYNIARNISILSDKNSYEHTKTYY